MKTIAEHMKDVLIKNDCDSVMWGDCHNLDECANECKHTNLMKLHPLTRHQRIFNALEKSKLFKKKVVLGKPGYRGNQHVRVFMVVMK